MPVQEKKASYTSEQIIEIARVHDLTQGAFKYLERPSQNFTEGRRVKARQIVENLKSMVEGIRVKKRTIDDFFAYQDAHYEDSDHFFLNEVQPGLTANGWMIFLAMVDPVKYGGKIQRTTVEFSGTISHRSAKS